MSKMLGVILLLFFIVAGVLYLFVFTGVIKIESSLPPKATVQIDGVVTGPTPLKMRVRAGTHQIMVYKDGFESWQAEAKVKGYSPLTVTVKLRLLLRSDPPGAKVTMDGKYIGVTDLPYELKPGIHLFEFKKSGYQSAKFRATIPEVVSESLPVVTLNPGKEPTTASEENFSAESSGMPAPTGFGAIQVTSKPDAQIYLDGELQGETPLTIKKVRVGSYVISLSKEGYKEMRQTVYVRKDETTKVAGELKPGSTEQ